MAVYQSPLNVTLWPSSFLKKYGPMIPPAHKAQQTGSPLACGFVCVRFTLPSPHPIGSVKGHAILYPPA
ncbi:hypothetical protein TNCV_4377851 [Trichonephila clavipes]|nr:hypothetical protein TNCV_4377851 [Trichonephila clavipes]